MIRKITTSKSIWGALFAYGFGVLVFSFATSITRDAIIVLGSLAVIAPASIGLLIKWVDFRRTKERAGHFLDLNPDRHFAKGFLGQFGGIILWLIITTIYAAEDWHTDTANLIIFITSSLIASALVLILMPAEEPTDKEKIIYGN